MSGNLSKEMIDNAIDTIANNFGYQDNAPVTFISPDQMKGLQAVAEKLEISLDEAYYGVYFGYTNNKFDEIKAVNIYRDTLGLWPDEAPGLGDS